MQVEGGNTFKLDFYYAGVTNFVYKAATHNRAEHCIGTAFLCSRLLETIEQNSSQEIDELHKKCVVVSRAKCLFADSENNFVHFTDCWTLTRLGPRTVLAFMGRRCPSRNRQNL